MSEPQPLHDDPCHLGEGPTYHRETDTAFWFDILGRTLFEHRFAGNETLRHSLPFMASQLSFVDGDRQLLAADAGLFLRDRRSGETQLLREIEPGRTATLRSNDGRTHPSGALWIGTMGRQAETGAGAIHWFRAGEVRRIVPDVSIPNGICFSPDGATGYYVDTKVNRLMRLPLDPATGLPAGEATLFHDASADGESAPGIDGAVVDAEGTVLAARWDGGRVDAFDPNTGRRVASHAVPALKTSCPAFVGPALDRMIVTTAYEGMDDAARRADPFAGRTFLLPGRFRGAPDPNVLI